MAIILVKCVFNYYKIVALRLSIPMIRPVIITNKYKIKTKEELK
jgi:hypothetical protein